MEEERRNVHVDMRVSRFHELQIFRPDFRLEVDYFFLVSGERRALGIEEKQAQLGAEVLYQPAHGADVLVLERPHAEYINVEMPLFVVRTHVAVQLADERAKHLAEELVLAREVVVDVAHRHACLACHRADGGAPYACCDELGARRGENALPYVVFQSLHVVWFFPIMNIVRFRSQKKTHRSVEERCA